MSDSNVLGLIENAGKSMTFEEGFAFIKRSRRQLDRFCSSNPAAKGMRIVPQFEAEVRAGLNSLEAELLALMPRA